MLLNTINFRNTKLQHHTCSFCDHHGVTEEQSWNLISMFYKKKKNQINQEQIKAWKKKMFVQDKPGITCL